MKIGEEQARAVVHARLGREPGDYLESAVVLEAWGGLRGAVALEVAPPWRDDARPGHGRRNDLPRKELLKEGTAAFAASLLATMLLLMALHHQLSHALTDRAWHVVVPVGMAIQWVARRRYPPGRSRPNGDRLLLGFLALVGLGLAVASADETAILAGLLLLIWGGAAALVGTPPAPLHPLLVGGAALAAVMDLPLSVVLLVPSVGTVLLVARAMQPWRAGTWPIPWIASLPAALPGFALGTIILEASVAKAPGSGVVALVTLIPSLISNVVAGRHLRRMWLGLETPTRIIMEAVVLLVVLNVTVAAVLLGVTSVVDSRDLGVIAAGCALLSLISALTFPVALMDAFRFDLALAVASVGSLAIVQASPGTTGATLAGCLMLVLSAGLVGRLLRHRVRFRALPL